MKCQVKQQGNEQKQLDQYYENKKKKDQLLEEKALMASLFNACPKKQVQDDVDPKTILCAYFKQGLCQKGKKCKYSHDMKIEQKSENIDIYVDQRNQLFDSGVNEEETMEDWNEQQLQSVVKANENKYKSQKPTEIVCKFFLNALEHSKYGWKWQCPNGMTCIYRHCLPPNFVFKKKSDKREEAEEDDRETLEQVIDSKISQLGVKGTPVTLERFLEWKEKKKAQKETQLLKEQKEIQKRGGGKNAALSGRALFKIDPTLFVDDENAEQNIEYKTRVDDQSEDEYEEKDYNKIDEQVQEENEDNDEKEEKDDKDFDDKIEQK